MKRKRVLYQEVAEQLKEDILTGKYPVGALLPTENELEETFEVSKITVRRAIELLAVDEYVEKRSGRGTTVLSNRPYNKLSKATTFTQLLENSGKKVEKKNISYGAITLEATHPAYSLLGAEVFELQRVYLLEQQPYIYYTYYFPNVFMELDGVDFEDKSLYRLLAEQHLEIETFRDSFQPIILTDKQQEHLATKETMALKRIRTSFAENRKVVEYSEGIYNTALYPYIIEFET